MNRSIPKLIGAGVISLSLAVLPLTLPASAQDAAPGATAVETEQGDRDFDWGWLGLLGLIGLAGLKGGQREDTSNVGSRTTYR